MLMEIDQLQQLATELDDLLAQFAKLAEDVSVTESEQEIQQASEQLSEVADRLRSWRARLEARRFTLLSRLLCSVPG
jgi:ABC-type transporter Mla subunit MlaD